MQILSSSVQTSSFHSASVKKSSEISTADLKKANQSNPSSAVSISGIGQSLASQLTDSNPLENITETQAPIDGPSEIERKMQEAQEKVKNDPRLQLLRGIVEAITGHKIEGLDVEESENKVGSEEKGSPRFFLQTTKTSYEEKEKTSFESNGTVTLSDGSKINWNISMNMERYYRQDSSTTVVVDAKKQDPLVINLDGGPVELQGQRMQFDLNGDGKLVDMPMLSGQRGYLALDKNNNGKVDNGLELFGPQSNNGFAELARYDEDGNGWIDSGDSIFEQLRIWMPNVDGSGLLSSLEEFGLAAIQLSATNTPFELKDENNQSLGSIRATGVYLTNSGQAGTVQQIDVTI